VRGLLIILAFSGLEAVATAQVRGANEHEGFYLRLHLGGGGVSMTTPNASASGAGAAFGISIGGAVAPNVILYAAGFDDVAIDPNIRYGSLSGPAGDATAGVYGFGPGVAIYFMPVNVYLSATVALSHIIVEQHDADIARSNWGPGISLMLGKEWWASDHWGLGVALQVYGGRIPAGGDGNPTWSVGALSLAFSATYN